MELTDLLWDEANEAHIARHQVRRDEVVQVVFSASAIFAVEDAHREGRVLVFGVTETGRHLLRARSADDSGHGVHVVTARSMTTRERREYEEALE